MTAIRNSYVPRWFNSRTRLVKTHQIIVSLFNTQKSPRCIGHRSFIICTMKSCDWDPLKTTCSTIHGETHSSVLDRFPCVSVGKNMFAVEPNLNEQDHRYDDDSWRRRIFFYIMLYMIICIYVYLLTLLIVLVIWLKQASSCVGARILPTVEGHRGIQFRRRWETLVSQQLSEALGEGKVRYTSMISFFRSWKKPERSFRWKNMRVCVCT